MPTVMSRTSVTPAIPTALRNLATVFGVNARLSMMMMGRWFYGMYVRRLAC